MASTREYAKRSEALEREAYKPFDMGEVIVLFRSCFREGPLVGVIAKLGSDGEGFRASPSAKGQEPIDGV
jgi:hypothetical protein